MRFKIVTQEQDLIFPHDEYVFEKLEYRSSDIGVNEDSDNFIISVYPQLPSGYNIIANFTKKWKRDSEFKKIIESIKANCKLYEIASDSEESDNNTVD